jgi:hypothetical protein
MEFRIVLNGVEDTYIPAEILQILKINKIQDAFDFLSFDDLTVNIIEQEGE